MPVQLDIQSSIIAYKQFVWQNFALSAWKTNLTNFIDKLQNNEAIRSFWHVDGYIDEFISLENDYFHSKNDIDFIPMYEFVRHRFEQQTQHQKQAIENPNYSRLFYAALITKVLALRNHNHITTISDLRSDYNSTKRNIEDLIGDRIGYIKRMCDANENSLEARFQSAGELVESISTSISRIRTRPFENRCDDCIEQLQAQMIREQMVTSLKIIQSFLSLTMHDIDALRKDASDKNVQIDSITNFKRRSPVMITTASAPFTAQISRIAENLHFKTHPFKELLDDFDSILKQDTSNKLNEIQQIVADLSTKMDEISANNRMLNENLADAFIFGQTNLTNAIDRVKQRLKMSNTKASERLGRMQSLLKCFALGLETYQNCRNNPKKLTALNEQIDRFQGDLHKWTEYKQSIYRAVLPQSMQMDESMQNAIVLNDTHFTLDVRHWNIRPTLAELDKIFDRIRRRPLFDENIEFSMDLMKQQIKLFFSLYNHIRVYSDRVKLVALLEYIETSTKRPETDPKIQTKMAILNDDIYSNLMLEICKTVIQVQKMYNFPFGRNYSTLCDISTPFAEISHNSSQLIKQAFFYNIDDLISRREDSIASETIFDTNQPFYQWKYHDFKDQIQQLLNGKTVTFNSVATLKNWPSMDKNAMKFRKIQINFKLENETKQIEFNDVLKNFQVMMRIIGNNYYKCGRRIYTIPIDVDVSFQFNIVNNTTIISKSNGIDSKFMQRKPFLSPYTVWNIQLISESSRFDELKAFENEDIELQLLGDGRFIEDKELGQQACNDDLIENYQLDRIL